MRSSGRSACPRGPSRPRNRARPGARCGVWLLVAWLHLGSGTLAAAPLRFFAVGDLPYSALEMAPLARLLGAATRQGTPFLVHLGDIKSGGSPCTDANLEEIAGLFQAQPVPMVYTPGDNEWTDCHRVAAGGHDPLERLKRVREVFFADPSVLRLDGLGVERPDPAYPENLYFMHSGVMLVALHLVGSNNGFDTARPATLAEFEAREAAGHALLELALGAALERGAQALVLMFQANPLFERGQGPRGFKSIKRDLVALMERFPGPVLVLHGDTHRFRHDHPLLDPRSGAPMDRLTRVEVPGSPMVGGVWIGVDAQAPEPFTVDPLYAASLVAEEGDAVGGDGIEGGEP